MLPTINSLDRKEYSSKTTEEAMRSNVDMFLGSPAFTATTNLWVAEDGAESEKFVCLKNATHCLALSTALNELLINAVDTYLEDDTLTTYVDINYDKETDLWTVRNDGRAIRIVKYDGKFIHTGLLDSNPWLPTVIFGSAFTSANYDNSKIRITGGKNGIGAKATRVNSDLFEVSICDGERFFNQKWIKSIETPAYVSDNVTDDRYVEIKWRPRFSTYGDEGGVELMTPDIIGYLYRRCFDVATNNGLQVFLNGTCISNSFYNYVKKFSPEFVATVNTTFKIELTNKEGDAKFVYWKVLIGAGKQSTTGGNITLVNNLLITDPSSSHISQMNSLIAKQWGTFSNTSKAGKNRNALIKKFGATSFVKKCISFFLSCQIDKPQFASQAKAQLHMSKAEMDRYFKYIQAWAQSDAGTKQLNEVFTSDYVTSLAVEHESVPTVDLKSSSTRAKSSYLNLLDIKHLADANNAGTSKWRDTTLFICEGTSAHNAILNGFASLSTDERKNMGVYPIRGKLINVRTKKTDKVDTSHEIQSLLRIIGLDKGKSPFISRRYGRIVIACDFDLDGFHITGLLLNFLHYYWPEIFDPIHSDKRFVYTFITPLLKVGDTEFYSVKSYDKWAVKHKSAPKPKYYKGLGTSSPAEFRKYFENLEDRHLICIDNSDVNATDVGNGFSVAFGDNANVRKVWINDFLNNLAGGGEEGFDFLNEKRSIDSNTFFDKNMVRFSIYDSVRSIPSMIDGLKPSQRKVLYAAFKRTNNKEIKVAQFGAYAAQVSSYHHGEKSLSGVIVNMAQDFVGSNNLNLFEPSGNFGSRRNHEGSADRYIFTRLMDYVRNVFIPEDDAIVHYLFDDSERIEPKWYIPVIPMVLVNGAKGIGSGWSCDIPMFNPVDIIDFCLGKETTLIPWYRGYKGIVSKTAEHGKYELKSNFSTSNGGKTLHITEVPATISAAGLEYVTNFIAAYREGIVTLDKTGNGIMYNGKECSDDHSLPSIKSMLEFIREFPDKADYPISISPNTDHTDANINCSMTFATKERCTRFLNGIYNHFRSSVRAYVSYSNLHLFDKNGVIKKYSSPEEIIIEFAHTRLEYYEMRRIYMIAQLSKLIELLENRIRYYSTGYRDIGSHKKSLSTMLEYLLENKYSRYVDVENRFLTVVKELGINGYSGEIVESSETSDIRSKEFSYILNTNLASITDDRVSKLRKELEEYRSQRSIFENTTAGDMWAIDLNKLRSIIA